MRFWCVLLGAGLMQAQDMAPVPADPHELVTGMAQVPSSPADRASIIGLLERARQNSDMHMPGTPPFVVKMSFTVTGNSAYTGMGQVSETWFPGRWRYDQSLGSYSETRIGNRGQTFVKREGGIPLRMSMLRTAMFWPVGGNPAINTIRTAAAEWNGKPVTCVLTSGSTDSTPPGRHWAETEYCVDNSSGLLQIFSRAPGTFAIYGYSKNLQFHGRTMADRITIYVAGTEALDAQLTTVEDAGSADPAVLTPSSDMTPEATAGMNMRFPIGAPNPTPASSIKPVIVHTSIDTKGSVIEQEVSAAADPALGTAAMDLVKKTNFGAAPSQREVYINVRFFPSRAGQ
jgi:hypothetical protein